MRTLETVLRELKAAEDDLSVIRDRVHRLRRERDALAVEAASDPWLGKAVKRTSLVGYSRNKKQVTNRGTVVAYDPTQHRKLRNVYCVEAGDPIVIHPGGKTGWRLYERNWRTNELTTEWELDDTQTPPSSGTQSPPPDNTDV